MESYTNISKAIADVLEQIAPDQRLELVPTLEAIGRVVARGVRAPKDSPEFRTSHMDGYAVASSNFRQTSSSTRLRAVGEVNPEDTAVRRLSRGEAVRVSTGSRIPQGADTVVPIEDVKEENGWVVTSSKPGPGDFVYKAGADFRKGELLIRRNQKLRAQDIGQLLSIGLDEVEVLRVPTVAFLATGSELYEAGKPSRGRTLNTHGPIFLSLVRALGCSPLDFGISPDLKEELAARIEEALDRADLVLVSGGTSVGRRDLVGGVVERLKPSVFHHGLRMDRGRVAGVAVVRGKPLVMLPGPVQGAMNAFLLLALPVIERLRGGVESGVRIQARMSVPWKARERFKNFKKVLYVRLGDDFSAQPVIGETESITVLTSSSGYVVVPERVTKLERGDFVVVNLIPGFSHAV